MRVALVSGAPPQSGSEIGGAYFTRGLAEALVAAGIDAEIWGKRGAGEAAGSKAPVRAIWRPGWFAWWDLIRAVSARRPDVVHVQHSVFLLGNGASGEFSMLILLALLALRRVRLVVTCHDTPSLQQITPEYVRLHGYRFPAWVVVAGLRAGFWMIGASARAILVHQEAFARILERDYGIRAQKITVVPLVPIAHGISDSAEARVALGLAADAELVLFFGFATRYKGIELLLDAMAQVNRPKLMLILGAGEHPKVTGMPSYREYYRSVQARASSVRNIAFAGFLPDESIDAYIDAADLAIFPYIEFQSMSGPLNQVAAHAKPFLVSRRIAEKTPQLEAAAFEPTAQAIAATITRFFSDARYRETVETECRNFSERLLGADVVGATLATYEAALR